jgi:alkylation response protein AidB-like acyl-CoA dehydrogenase
MVDFSLSEEQELIQETARSFGASLREGLRDFEESGAVSADVMRSYCDLGLAAIDLPESVDGANLGLLTQVLAIEELAFSDLGSAYGLPGFEPAVRLVRALGDNPQHKQFLGPYLTSPGWLGAVAWHDGDDTVEAVASGDGWTLRGQKLAVERAPVAGFYVVRARTGEGDRLFVVAAGAEGITVGERRWKLGLLATACADVVFDVEVGAGALLRDDDDALRKAWLSVAVQTAAMHLGVARAAHAYALQYTQERVAFGKPVAHFQAVAFMLADEAMLVDAARWSIWRGAWALDGDKADAAQAVGHALVNAYEIATRLVDDGVQLLGGAGYVFDHPVEKWMRDQKTLSLTGVTPEAAEDLLTAVLLGESWTGEDLVAGAEAQAGLL